ncbi:lactadherin-like [Clavelina lepadiformis]|uniref:lactadherin-like n=1 Tax=Clavelina lepadiformis TaxID=159417 RepID=UPI004041D8C4
MIFPRFLWIFLMTYSLGNGAINSYSEAYTPIPLSPTQNSSTVIDGFKLAVGPQGPRGIPGRCGCDPSEIAQMYTKFEKLEDTLENITAKLERLSELHHYAITVDQCDHMPCKNGGTCINDRNSYICNCTDDYEGHDCSIRVQCVVPAAPNNGTVFPQSGQLVPHKENITYRCNNKYVVAYDVNNYLVATCHKKKWTRYTPVCVLDHCDPGSCSGRGTCINEIGRIICECDEGYEGNECLVESNPCHMANPPCGQSGVCFPEGGRNYLCRCLPGYKGRHCETFKTSLCRYTVGMEDRRVQNRDITASRYSSYPATYARLQYSNSWRLHPVYATDWLQVDLRKNTTVAAVATQGDPGSSSYYVRSYKIAYGFSQDALQIMQNSGGEDLIFQGNRDSHTIVRNNFPAPVTARYFKILLHSWNTNYAGLRVEYYTCDP